MEHVNFCGILWYIHLYRVVKWAAKADRVVIMHYTQKHFK
jgi:hypothetical protein